MTPQPSAKAIHTPQSSPLWPLVLVLSEIAIRVERDAATAARPGAHVVESDGPEDAISPSSGSGTADRGCSGVVQS